VALGGTIAMTHESSASVVPRLTAEDLIRAVPHLGAVAEVGTIDFRRRPGASLTIDDIAELAELLHREDENGTAGFVVTQGTDTLEETAYLLDVLYRGSTPVILTGAMRNPTMAGADGPANLLAAAQTAACPEARGRGVLVVFADQVHSAAHVQKVHSTSTSAFTSVDSGPVGHVYEGEPRFHSVVPPGPKVAVPFSRPAEVEVVEATLGSTGALLDGLEQRIDGLVVSAFGAGHVPEGWVDRLEKLALQMPVVLTSRTGAGPVLTSTYGFPGSEKDLLARGLIRGGVLHPRKARLLLLAHLRAGAQRATMETAFRHYC
jgi:L-asparaginase